MSNQPTASGSQAKATAGVSQAKATASVSQAKPTLAGPKIKTRKRTEVVKYDRSGFKDSILQGLSQAGDNAGLAQYLIDAGGKLNFRTYYDVLLDILIVGGVLGQGGTVQAGVTERCVFGQYDDLETIKDFNNVFIQILRRYKYLERLWEEEMKKILKFINRFDENHRSKLAKITALFLSNQLLSASILNNLHTTDILVKEGHSLTFITQVFQSWLREKDISHVSMVLRRAQLDDKLDRFFPASKSSPDEFQKHFLDNSLQPLADFQRIQVTNIHKKDLKAKFDDILTQDTPSIDELEEVAKDAQNNLIDSDICWTLWRSILPASEWNWKEEQVAEYVLTQLETYSCILQKFAQTGKSQLIFLIKLQDFCYDNIEFMQLFHKIILLLYMHDVIVEDAVLKWFYEVHIDKGKNMFLENMKRMVDWLDTALEESASDTEIVD
ncbi:Basic leucine zipper and W2 domain-containing protein 1-A [Oopsacas minuta]|uniref:Basic leucine zipper and W2 domain-containing protein 1-A n=1 Tax=Oopsacas minuta TaxID=111878 RepID=A0AAV7K813_9METZ|nr:Basic leucine zipper and W2 domain-containing protein 1-A [Oopsacas minuta]